MLSRRNLLVLVPASLPALLAAGRTQAQLLASEAATRPPTLGDIRVQRYRVGVIVAAEGGPCGGIYATLPVPAEWPEQQVMVIKEEVSKGVRDLHYRPMGGGVQQLVVTIPSVAAGGKEYAVMTLEL